LAHHNAQLEASAFREEYDPDTFEDLTLPKLDMIHKVFRFFERTRIKNLTKANQRAGKLITIWKEEIASDKSSHVVIISSGTKRKAVSMQG
jgi:ATP-dependent DNA helicase 2 subunit 1